MEKPRPVACIDTSPCIGLARLGLLEILPKVFGGILVPEMVVTELMSGMALDNAWQVIQLPGVTIIQSNAIPRVAAGIQLASQLHAGEREVISLARGRPCTAIIDDGHARSIAAQLGVHVIGTVGLLQLAKRRGLIPEIRPLLESLAASGFRIAPDVVRLAIEQAGE